MTLAAFSRVRKRWRLLRSRRTKAGSVVLLRSRHLPDDGGLIDRIGIGPAGVTVIERGLAAAARERDFAEEIAKQVAAVSRLLAEERISEVPVHGALCLAKPRELATVSDETITIERPRDVAKLMRRPGRFDAFAVDYIAQALDRRLPPA